MIDTTDKQVARQLDPGRLDMHGYLTGETLRDFVTESLCVFLSACVQVGGYGVVHSLCLFIPLQRLQRDTLNVERFIGHLSQHVQ